MKNENEKQFLVSNTDAEYILIKTYHFKRKVLHSSGVLHLRINF